MHELGVVIEVINSIQKIVDENQLTKVNKLVLQIGELSSMIPQYIESCYPVAIDGTMFEETKLEIEILPGNGMCRACDTVYNIIKNRKICPKCQSEDFELISGREFMIKEIEAY